MPTADYQQKVERALEALEESESVHGDNAALVKEYRRDKQLNGMSDATQQRNISYLKKVAEHVEDTRFEDMDKSEVKEVVSWVHDRDLADATVDTYKKAIRSFWTWLNDGDNPDDIEEIAWIELSNSNGKDKLPQDLLTREEIDAQVEAAKNPRDKALIKFLYETGARIGEIIDLTVGDIEDRQHGKKVVIDGKTGSRRLPLVESVPYLNNWLSSHPNPEKDAPLWCKIQQGDPDDKLGYQYVREKILKKNMERAGIDKPSNPHHYRHSRATELATEMTEAELCEWFGWVQSSDVPQRYVTLSGRDIDDRYDQIHGIKEPEEEDTTPDVRKCPRCDELNEPDAGFCMRCGFALDQDAKAEQEQVEETAQESIPEIQNDTEAQVVQAVLEDLRENPEEFLAD